MREKRKLEDWDNGEDVWFDRIEIQHITQTHTAYMLANGCQGLLTDQLFDSFHDAYAELKKQNGPDADIDEQIVRVVVSIIPDNGDYRYEDFNERGRHKWGSDSR
ncbi:hypothetical protein [Henriciella sp.]|uniref:hypothetical protein n=1 Tax=Henriciella sp. TaxID=1968823 RepID=UPI00261CA02F|nr:hypothetical protein [Henriciella sp.]